MKRLENIRIVLKDRITTGSLIIENGKITHVIEHDCDFQHTVIPGFIDLKNAGGYGFDFIDGRTNGGFESYCQNLLISGVSSIVQSTHAVSRADLKKAIQDYVRYKNLPKSDRRAHHLGINLSGVWINKSQNGEHDPEFIEEGELSYAIHLMEMAQESIIISEIAMEIEKNMFVGRWLKEKGKTVLLANTNIKMEVAENLWDRKYFDGVANLYTNMSGYDSQRPGLLPCVLTNRHIKVIMPIDERRINFDLLVKTIKSQGSRKIILASFSTKDNQYKLIDGFKKLVKETDIPIYEICKMLSTNPARLINYGSQKGEIKVGLDADLIIIDNDLDIVEILIKGQ